jgi:hypothetical protein
MIHKIQIKFILMEETKENLSLLFYIKDFEFFKLISQKAIIITETN